MISQQIFSAKGDARIRSITLSALIFDMCSGILSDW